MISVRKWCSEKVYHIKQARSLLKSLLIFGALSGLIMGSIGASIPLLFPKLFSPDPEVIGEVSSLLYVSPMTTSISWIVQILVLSGFGLP